MKKWLAFLLIMTMALAACSSTGSDEDPNTSSGTDDVQAQADDLKILRYGRDLSFLGNLDVWLTTYLSIFETSDCIFDRLLEKDPETLELQLSLLEEWPEISEDGLTYTYKLKEGVQFHNGAELTANDVAYTFNLFFDPERASINTWVAEMILGADALMKGEADSLEGFEVIDDYRFSITLEYPYTAFDTILAVSMLPILPAEAREEAGDRWGIDVIIGTGPYMVEEFIPNVSLKLKANPDYHGKKPEIDGIEVVHMLNETALIEWEAGNIDVCPIDSLEMVANFQEKYSNNVIEQEFVGTIWLQLNQEMAPLDNVLVREALALATNKEEIANAYLNGYVKVADTFLPSGIPGHNPDAQQSGYDPERAKVLLAEAGYADGITVTAMIRSESSYREILQILKQQYQEAGIDLDIQLVDAAGWTESRSSGNMQMFIMDWYADYMDGDMFMYSIYHSSNATFWSTGFRNDDFDENLMTARTLPVDEKSELYQEMDHYLVFENYALIPLYQDKGFILRSDRVSGVFKKKDMLMTFINASIQ